MNKISQRILILIILASAKISIALPSDLAGVKATRCGVRSKFTVDVYNVAQYGSDKLVMEFKLSGFAAPSQVSSKEFSDALAKGGVTPENSKLIENFISQSGLGEVQRKDLLFWERSATGSTLTHLRKKVGSMTLTDTENSTSDEAKRVTLPLSAFDEVLGAVLKVVGEKSFTLAKCAKLLGSSQQ